MHSAVTRTSGATEGKCGPHFAPQLARVLPPVVSIIVPVYNEQATITAVLERLNALPLAKEIVVVDDASSDGTRETLSSLDESWPVKVLLKPTNEGKGAAIRTGLSYCTGDIVVIQDADLEYNPREIPRLVAAIRAGDADVVYGSRFLDPEAHHQGGVRWLHRCVNGLLTWLSNRATGLALTDMETCYKAVRRDAFEGLTIEQNRFGFEPEITAKLARKKLRFVEVPISYAPRGYRDGKKIMPIDLVKAIYAIVRYCWKK